MKAEALAYAASSIATSAIGTAAGLPPEQVLFLWSVAGTVCGAAVASLQMPPTTTKQQRFGRAAMSLLVGLLIAPYAIANIPVSAGTPPWWHAFAASGIGAALSYVVVSEAPRIARAWLRLITRTPDDRP